MFSVDSIKDYLYNLYSKLYIKYNGGRMRIRCVCCESPFIYILGDSDCSALLCSYCFSDKELKTVSTKWNRLRFKILTRDKYICRYCGDSPMRNDKCILNVDHVDPVSISHNNGENNLLTSCMRCNFGKCDIPLTREAKETVDSYISTTKEIK